MRKCFPEQARGTDMNRLNLDNIVQDRVRISITDTELGICVKFDGEIDMEDPEIVLDPLFDKIHKGAVEQGFAEITADFNRLIFLNTGGIEAVAKWVMKLSDLTEDNRYKIKIKHNRDITWQVTNLRTLTYLVAGAVDII
jgi:hypothetical protein